MQDNTLRAIRKLCVKEFAQMSLLPHRIQKEMDEGSEPGRAPKPLWPVDVRSFKVQTTNNLQRVEFPMKLP